MKKSVLFRSIVLALATVLVIGCTKAPTEETPEAPKPAVSDEATDQTRARDESAAAVNAAKLLLAEAESALTSARDVKNISLDFATAAGELQDSAGLIAEAETDMAGGRYADAGTKAQTARSAISAVQRRIADAVQAAARSK